MVMGEAAFTSAVDAEMAEVAFNTLNLLGMRPGSLEAKYRIPFQKCGFVCGTSLLADRLPRFTCRMSRTPRPS